MSEQHPYERWAAFCDAAQVAPDTLKSYDELAERYELCTGIAIQPSEIVRLIFEADEEVDDAVPSMVRGLDDMVMPYCEDHAQGVLADKQVFPGARRVTVLS
jgi:hypothetical protein